MFLDRFKNFAIETGNFYGSHIVSGLLELCDVPDLRGQTTLRPRLAKTGTHNLCFKAEDTLSCSRGVVRIYEAAGVPENNEGDLFDGGHRFADNKAFDFFEKQLKGGE